VVTVGLMALTPLMARVGLRRGVIAGVLKLGPDISIFEAGWWGWPGAVGIRGGMTGLSGAGGGREGRDVGPTC
jgi:hypothetical protein